MKNLKVNVPEGHEIDQDKSTFENIVFKKVDTDKDKEKLFLELFQGLTMKSDVEKHPNSVFYFKNDKCMLEIKDSILWVSSFNVWSAFKNKFDMDYEEVQNFIKNMVGKHFNWKGLTPKIVWSL